MKTGLILEGGAMRGLFTAGVIDVLMENNIVFDGAVGVSAGAAFGINYKSGQKGRVLRYSKKYGQDKRYSGFYALLKDGNIFSSDFCYGEVQYKLDKFDFDSYIKNPMEFHLVCTDVNTGKPVYHNYTGKEDNGLDWIRASASMPLVSKMVEIDGKTFLDGGISDSIPVKYFKTQGYDRNVVVLTQPKGYQKKKNSLLFLAKKKYKKYPRLVDAIANRHIMYNNELAYVEQEERNGSLFVIRPKKAIEVSRVEKNPDKLQEAYDMGREVACEALEDLKIFLKN